MSHSTGLCTDLITPSGQFFEIFRTPDCRQSHRSMNTMRSTIGYAGMRGIFTEPRSYAGRNGHPGHLHLQHTSNMEIYCAAVYTHYSTHISLFLVCLHGACAPILSLSSLSLLSLSLSLHHYLTLTVCVSCLLHVLDPICTPHP